MKTSVAFRSVKSKRYSETEICSTDFTNKCTVVILGGCLPIRRWRFQVSKYNTVMYYTEASHFINAIVQQIVNEYITVVALYDNHKLSNCIIKCFSSPLWISNLCYICILSCGIMLFSRTVGILRFILVSQYCHTTVFVFEHCNQNIQKLLPVLPRKLVKVATSAYMLSSRSLSVCVSAHNGWKIWHWSCVQIFMVHNNNNIFYLCVCVRALSVFLATFFCRSMPLNRKLIWQCCMYLTGRYTDRRLSTSSLIICLCLCAIVPGLGSVHISQAS
jgi:hypothetical protein